jgi:uncharacterized protein YndB with AHSA1/START domain
MATPLTIRACIAAPVATVYRALTDAAALRVWLAEHAEVALAEGRFAFWGRHTPQGELGRQRLLAVEPDRLLRFAWLLDGEETTAELTLAADGPDATFLTLVQTGVPTMDEMMATTGARDGLHSLHTFWGLAIANLAEYTEGRDLTPKADFSAGHHDVVRITVAVAAPPDRVFASLIEPEQIDRWFGGNAEVEPRVGGRIGLFGGDAAGTIVELVPDQTLAYTADSTDDKSLVRWELAATGDHTLLTLTDSSHADDTTGSAAQHEAGWLGAMAELRRIHALGPAWQPMTLEFTFPK